MMKFVGFDEDITPESRTDVSKVNLDYLHRLSISNPGGTGDRWAMEEIRRRQNEQLEKLLTLLNTATHSVSQEVSILNSLSTKMEDLTVTLTNLTAVLILLTVTAILVPIGIE